MNNALIRDYFIRGFNEEIFPALKKQGYAETPFSSNYFGKSERGGAAFDCYAVDQSRTLRRMSMSLIRGDGNWGTHYLEYHLDRDIANLSELSEKSGTYLVQGGRYKYVGVTKRKNWWLIHPPVDFGIGSFSTEAELEEQMQRCNQEWVNIFETQMPRIIRDWNKFCGPTNPVNWSEWPVEEM